MTASIALAVVLLVGCGKHHDTSYKDCVEKGLAAGQDQDFVENICRP